MNTQTGNPVALPPEAYIFVTASLCKTPTVREVKLIQVCIAGGALLKDARGFDLPPDPSVPPDINEQTFTAADLDKKQIVFQKGMVAINWKITGQLPRPIIPNLNMLHLYLQKLNKNQPIPVQLAITEFNIDTFEYEAISTSPPLLQQAAAPVAKKPPLIN